MSEKEKPKGDADARLRRSEVYELEMAVERGLMSNENIAARALLLLCKHVDALTEEVHGVAMAIRNKL